MTAAAMDRRSSCELCEPYQQSTLEDSGISSNEHLQQQQNKQKLSRILRQISRVKSVLLLQQTKSTSSSGFCDYAAIPVDDSAEHIYDRFGSTESSSYSIIAPTKNKVKRRHTKLYYDSLRGGHRSLPTFAAATNDNRPTQKQSSSLNRKTQTSSIAAEASNNKHHSWNQTLPQIVQNQSKRSNVVKTLRNKVKPSVRLIKFNGQSDFIFGNL